jgi:isopentenyl-diphosphate delta-isomerase
MTNIIFVDENDVCIGAGSKQEATTKGIIHRVIRIFITNSKGEILLQRRSDNCYTSPGKWDQSVGGHVDEGESYDEAA